MKTTTNKIYEKYGKSEKLTNKRDNTHSHQQHSSKMEDDSMSIKPMPVEINEINLF